MWLEKLKHHAVWPYFKFMITNSSRSSVPPSNSTPSLQSILSLRQLFPTFSCLFKPPKLPRLSSLWWVLLLISMGKKNRSNQKRMSTATSHNHNYWPVYISEPISPPPSCCYGQTVPALGKANSPSSELSIVKSTSQSSPYSNHQQYPINSFLKHFSSFGFWDPTPSCSPTSLAPSFPVSLVSFSSSPWDQNVAVLQGSVLSPLLHLCSFLRGEPLVPL